MRNGLLTTFALTLIVAVVPAAPALAKKDGDCLPDKWEKRHHLNLRANDAARDRDHDGLSNYGEYRAHTNPRRQDSDRDGRRDSREDYDRDKLRNAAEIRTGNDPRDADSDNDGVKDGSERAGVIAAVDPDSVTIALASGGSITALIGEELEMKCKSKLEVESDDEEPEADAESESEDADEPGDPAENGDSDEDGSEDEPSAGSSESPDESSDDPLDALDLPIAHSARRRPCGREQLDVGAVVHEAEIKLTADGPVLVEIELLAARRR